MNNNYIVLVVALICGVLLLSVPMKCTGLSGNCGVEGFMSYFGYFKQYCPSCSNRDGPSCMKCLNCGICKKGNKKTCTQGESSGPWFSSDCDEWQYGTSDFYYPNSSIYPVSLSKRFWSDAEPSVRSQYKWNKLPIHSVK